MPDFYFHYLHITRSLLNSRLNLTNSYSFPYLSKLLLFFSLRNLTTLEDSAVYNYFYLFRFFLGRKAFIFNYRSFYSLRITYHSFDICVSFRKQRIFFPIGFYVNDLHRFLSLRGFHSYFLNPLCCTLILWDTHVFSERKTNLGLYNLKHPLNYRFFLSNGDLLSSKLLLDTLKIKLFF